MSTQEETFSKMTSTHAVETIRAKGDEVVAAQKKCKEAIVGTKERYQAAMERLQGKLAVEMKQYKRCRDRCYLQKCLVDIALRMYANDSDVALGKPIYVHLNSVTGMLNEDPTLAKFAREVGLTLVLCRETVEVFSEDGWGDTVRYAAGGGRPSASEIEPYIYGRDDCPDSKKYRRGANNKCTLRGHCTEHLVHGPFDLYWELDALAVALYRTPEAPTNAAQRDDADFERVPTEGAKFFQLPYIDWFYVDSDSGSDDDDDD